MSDLVPVHWFVDLFSSELVHLVEILQGPQFQNSISQHCVHTMFTDMFTMDGSVCQSAQMLHKSYISYWQENHNLS